VSKKKILVVDDSPLALELARDALSEAGYEVVVAQNLNELESVTGGSIDLVLMDVQMPELLGDDVAAVLRDVRGMRAPIFLLSGLDPGDLETRAKDAGLDGYISKHDGVPVLVDRVRGILAEAT